MTFIVENGYCTKFVQCGSLKLQYIIVAEYMAKTAGNKPKIRL